MNKLTITVSATALLVLLGGCAKKEEKEAEPVAPVQVAPVVEDTIRRIVTADAILYPRDQASVMPKINAPVGKFYVNRGDRVTQGQLLATLENRDLMAAAVASRGQFDQAEANYRGTAQAAVPEQVGKAKADVDAARQVLDAARKLLESRQKLYQDGALARRLVDEARASYAQANSQFDTAEQHLKALESVGKEEQIKGAAAQVAVAHAQYQAAEAQVSYSEIRSPIAGVVTDRPLYAGEMASAGAPLLTVMDISQVVARANVPQNQALFLKPGLAATITQTGSDDQAQGTITVVSPAVDPNTTTVQVWVQAPNPAGRLKPGATVHVAITAQTIPHALVVPLAAILPGAGGGTVVMVVSADSVAHERKVELGVRDEEKVQVVNGVKAGERVVAGGGVGLQDGAKVKIVLPGEKEAAGKQEGQDKDQK